MKHRAAHLLGEALQEALQDGQISDRSLGSQLMRILRLVLVVTSSACSVCAANFMLAAVRLGKLKRGP